MGKGPSSPLVTSAPAEHSSVRLPSATFQKSGLMPRFQVRGIDEARVVPLAYRKSPGLRWRAIVLPADHVLDARDPELDARHAVGRVVVHDQVLIEHRADRRRLTPA